MTELIIVDVFRVDQLHVPEHGFQIPVQFFRIAVRQLPALLRIPVTVKCYNISRIAEKQHKKHPQRHNPDCE